MAIHTNVIAENTRINVHEPQNSVTASEIRWARVRESVWRYGSIIGGFTSKQLFQLI
jgi:hypothetical protein